MEHSKAFLDLVDDAKSRIQQMTVPEFVEFAKIGERFILVDVREDHEWVQGHIPGAVHIGKGIVERDIEHHVPDRSAKIIFYCGGGYRTALVCDNLNKMGYTDTVSLDGGITGWVEAGQPLQRD